MGYFKRGVCSVIVPCYNVEKFIVDCVEKLHDQTYKKLEIILIDDGSTDKTLRLCHELEIMYNDVVTVTHNYDDVIDGQEATRNRGLEATRNRGLEKANGEWVLFLDADDFLENNAIEELTSKSRDSNADIVVFDFEMIYTSQSNRHTADLPNGFIDCRQFLFCMGNQIPWQIMSCVGNKLYKKSFIDKNGLAFNVKYKYNEDSAFFLSALDKNPIIVYHQYPFYKYIQRQNSINHSYRKNLYKYTNRVIVKLERLFYKNEMGDIKEWYIHYRRLYIVYYCLRDELLLVSKKSYYRMLNRLASDKEIHSSLVYNEKSKHLSFIEHILNKIILNKNKFVLISMIYCKKIFNQMFNLLKNSEGEN